ncbi:MAG: CotH kinase family protein [Deinococcales bacterium]
MKQVLTGLLAVFMVVQAQNSNANASWTEASHSNKAEPNYELVFPQDKVNELSISISPENWQAMLDDMTALYGERGSRPGPPGFAGNQTGDGAIDADGAMPLPPPGFAPPPPDGNFPPPPPGFGPPPSGFDPPPGAFGPLGDRQGFAGPPSNFSDSNPMWVEGTISFNGQTWEHVGVRFKGNSSLMGSWGAGTNWKLPFKFDFDEFEDSYPEIKNQRFYGFKQLSLSNNTRDASYQRDAISYDLLQEMGLIAPETAWYEISLDYGEADRGGIYTVVEVIDDTTVIERSLGSG